MVMKWCLKSNKSLNWANLSLLALYFLPQLADPVNWFVHCPFVHLTLLSPHSLVLQIHLMLLACSLFWGSLEITWLQPTSYSTSYFPIRSDNKYRSHSRKYENNTNCSRVASKRERHLSKKKLESTYICNTYTYYVCLPQNIGRRVSHCRILFCIQRRL